jgi:hypothetical protein
VALACTLVVCAGVAAAKVSRATRISPVSSAGAVAMYAHLATDGRGNATAIWQETIGAGGAVIMAATHEAKSGSWTTPVQISPSVGDIYGVPASAISPELAVDPAGGAAAVWQTNFGGLEAASRRSASGGWSTPVRLSPLGSLPDAPGVGIDAHGHALAVWTEQTSATASSSVVQASSLNIATGGWSTPTNITSSSKLLTASQVAVNASGQAVVVWKEGISGGTLGPIAPHNAIYAAVRTSATGEWQRPAQLGAEVEQQAQQTANTDLAGPQVALDAKGDALAVWQTSSSGHIAITDAIRVGGARTWRHEKPISTGAGLWPHVAMNPGGTVTVIWQSAGNQVSAASRQLPRGSWSRGSTFSTQEHSPGNFRVAVAHSGSAILSWTESGGPIAVTSRNGAHGRWTRPATLGSADAGYPSIALDPNGNADVLWVQPGRAVGSHPLIWIDAATYSIPH